MQDFALAAFLKLYGKLIKVSTTVHVDGLDLYSVIKCRINPIIPYNSRGSIIPDSFRILLFPKLFWHNVRMPNAKQRS